jgi:hypothetical protein
MGDGTLREGNVGVKDWKWGPYKGQADDDDPAHTGSRYVGGSNTNRDERLISFWLMVGVVVVLFLGWLAGQLGLV